MLHAQPGLSGHLTLTSIIPYTLLCTTKSQYNYKTSNHATNHQHTRINSVDVVISATYLIRWQYHTVVSDLITLHHTASNLSHFITLHLIYHPTTPNHTSETPNSNLVSSPSHHNHSVALYFLFILPGLTSRVRLCGVKRHPAL